MDGLPQRFIKETRVTEVLPNQLKVCQKHLFNLKSVIVFPVALFWQIIPVINHFAKAKHYSQICEAIIVRLRFAPRIQLTGIL